MKYTFRLLQMVAASLVCAVPAAAATIETVGVGNAGNTGELQPQGTFGAVVYDYRIGTYEVTIGQYVEFLNAVADTDTYGLFSTSMTTTTAIAGIARSGSPGSLSYSAIGSANKPVTFVSWGDGARFANWLHNGQPTGPQGPATTEDGAYSLNGATSAAALGAVSRNPGATWFLPSEDEWYKAAYHKNDGVTGNYWDYPTSTDATPYSDQPPGGDALTPSNTANFYSDDGLANLYDDGYAVTGSTIFSSSQNYLTDVGAYTASTNPYGTFDQGGNVAEWTEGATAAGSRVVRGGTWTYDVSLLSSGDRPGSFESEGLHNIGFRVAAVPEPGTALLAMLGCGIAAWLFRRRVAPVRRGEGMKYIVRCLLVGTACSICAAPPARAVTIPTVPVGNAGNAGQVQPQGIFGAVAYDYRIATTEVTNTQYVEFLNAKAASDPLDLYSALMGTAARGGITRSGSGTIPDPYIYAVKTDMGNKPVNHVSWYDAVRFANWLHNGQGAGDTETGAYTLLGGTATPSNANSILRISGATWFLTSEDEWYKAAYHQPAAQGGDSDDYWDFPTASNSVPTIATADSVGDISNPGSNVANYNLGADWNIQDGNVTTVGSAGPSSDSFYGTSDQGGSVFEWNEEPSGGSLRGTRGGAWNIGSSTLSAAQRGFATATIEADSLGFRVATVPEPSTALLAIVGGALAWWWKKPDKKDKFRTRSVTG
ncbi:MAG: SUMF1/EgtB/PvdO family nonheme iron enzyme [Pirellulales bacterium]